MNKYYVEAVITKSFEVEAPNSLSAYGQVAKRVGMEARIRVVHQISGGAPQFTFDDLRPVDFSKGHTHSFVCDLCDAIPELWGELNNNEVQDILKKNKIISRGDSADSESSCFYCYFKSLKHGQLFVSRLNEFVKSRYKKLKEVRS